MISPQLRDLTRTIPGLFDKMTRINLVPVSELADKHLLAEYRELPRCIKQDLDVSDAPDHFVFGKGHVKWARKNWKFLLSRFDQICKEMEYRGFNHEFSAEDLEVFFREHYSLPAIDFVPTEKEIWISRARLFEKISKKPFFYKWTKRPRPEIVRSEGLSKETCS